MSPVGAVFVQFPPKTGINLLHPRPPPQSLNGSIATDVSTGEGYRLRSLECLYPRPVLREPFSSEMAK